eukprot:g9271.t1
MLKGNDLVKQAIKPPRNLSEKGAPDWERFVFQVETYLALIDPLYPKYLEEAKKASESAASEVESAEHRALSIKLFGMLTSWLQDSPCAVKLARSVTHQDGFELWRLLWREFHPEQATKGLVWRRALLAPKFPTKEAEFSSALQEWENDVHRYAAEYGAEKGISEEDQRALTESPAALRQHLAIHAATLTTYQQVSGHVLLFVLHCSGAPWAGPSRSPAALPEDPTAPFLHPSSRQLVQVPLEFSSLKQWCEVIGNNLLAEFWYMFKEARASFSGYGTACGDELLLENAPADGFSQCLLLLDRQPRIAASQRVLGVGKVAVKLRGGAVKSLGYIGSFLAEFSAALELRKLQPKEMTAPMHAILEPKVDLPGDYAQQRINSALDQHQTFQRTRMGMKYVAAYLMAALAGKESPSADDIKAILDSVESEYRVSMARGLQVFSDQLPEEEEWHAQSPSISRPISLHAVPTHPTDLNLLGQPLGMCRSQLDSPMGWDGSGFCSYSMRDRWQGVCVMLSPTFREMAKFEDGLDIAGVSGYTEGRAARHWCLPVWAFAAAVERDPKGMEDLGLDCLNTNSKVRDILRQNVILQGPSKSYFTKPAAEILEDRCTPEGIRLHAQRKREREKWLPQEQACVNKKYKISQQDIEGFYDQNGIWNPYYTAGGYGKYCADESIASKLVSELEGKVVHEVVAAGKEKLKGFGGGGGGGAAVAVGGGGGGGGGGEAAAKKEEKKVVEEEEEEEMEFDLFG